MAEHTRDQSTENAEETLPTIEEMSGLIKTFGPPLDTEHTPGPWRSDSPYVSAPSGAHRKIVADCYQDPSWRDSIAISDDECIANARLIAAAPELLAALEQALAVIGSDAVEAARLLAIQHGMPYGPTVDVVAIRTLIAKTRGWWPSKARGEADPTSEDEEHTV